MLSMSELFVPKWSRSTRVSMSPMLDEEEQTAVVTQPVQSEALVPSDRLNKRRPLKGRKQKEKEKEREKEENTAAVPLRITLPPPHGILVDPNEPTWCYCNRVSFGEVSTDILVISSILHVPQTQMIGCDNPDCKYEWVSYLMLSEATRSNLLLSPVSFGVCGTKRGSGG